MKNSRTNVDSQLTEWTTSLRGSEIVADGNSTGDSKNLRQSSTGVFEWIS